MFAVIQNTIKEVPQRGGDLLDRPQPAMSRPEIPALPVFPGPCQAFILPQVSEHLLDRPSPRSLQPGSSEACKPVLTTRFKPFLATEPQKFGAGEQRVAVVPQMFVFLPAHLIDGLVHQLHDMEAVKNDFSRPLGNRPHTALI